MKKPTHKKTQLTSYAVFSFLLEYVKYGQQLLELVKRGISGGVYTQTTDVEGEVNGLITYDRKIIKVEEDRIKKINQEISNSLSE